MQAYWDAPIFAEHLEVRSNRLDARIINHKTKQVITLEWVNNRQENHGPLRWELKQQFPSYKIVQRNIIIDVLGGWSKDLNNIMLTLVGKRSGSVLRKMQKAVLSGSANIVKTF